MAAAFRKLSANPEQKLDGLLFIDYASIEQNMEEVGGK
jgi:hypothetical protein